MKQDLPPSLIVHCEKGNQLSQDSQKEEIVRLANAIGLEPSTLIEVKIRKLVPSTYMASGKIREVQEAIQQNKTQLVIFNGQLSPRQQEALEKEWQVKVLDRTALILEIFGKRAASREAKLQTELAQLAYQKGRLVRSWTHLERQRGGAGFMGGPGERQIESDRRQIAMKIKKISLRLDKVRRRRAQGRIARKKANYPVIALVGYTNSGKSTLFNLLTKDNMSARNMLFDTLDTKMRQMELLFGTKAILSDTVGFISDLPHDLVAAFSATLEEVSAADIIIHLRDFSHPDSLIQKRDVEVVLDTLHRGQPIIEVLNKLDKTKAIPMKNKNICAISATTGEGIEKLLECLTQAINKLEQRKRFAVRMPATQIEAQTYLYKKGQVLCQKTTKKGWHYDVILSRANAGFLKKSFADVEVQELGLAFKRTAAI